MQMNPRNAYTQEKEQLMTIDWGSAYNPQKESLQQTKAAGPLILYCFL